MTSRICLNCGSLEYRVEYITYNDFYLTHDGNVDYCEGDYEEINSIYCYECYEETFLIEFEIVREHKREVAKQLHSVEGDDRIVMFEKVELMKKELEKEIVLRKVEDN